jgi:hypothetical protein
MGRRGLDKGDMTVSQDPGKWNNAKTIKRYKALLVMNDMRSVEVGWVISSKSFLIVLQDLAFGTPKN